MCSKKEAKEGGAAAVIVKLSQEMPKRKKTAEEHRYMAGGQPGRWKGFVAKVSHKGVAYLDVGLYRTDVLFRERFDAFRKFMEEAYTVEALAKFKALETNKQMDLFEEELAALHAAYAPWQTGNDFPPQLHTRTFTSRGQRKRCKQPSASI